MLYSMFSLDHSGVCSITLPAVDRPVVGLSVNSLIVKKEGTLLHLTTTIILVD